MKKTLFCIFALFTCMGLFAQRQPVVAVAPFTAISGISATDASMITRVFFIRLGNAQKVSLVDRSVVERVLQEHRFQTGDWSNSQKTAELNKALNADWIVRGELEKFSNSILVTVQFYDIRTFRFMGGADLRLANVDEAYDKMDPLVNKLIETIAGSGANLSTIMTTETGRRVPGIYPQFVKEAIKKIPEDELVGVGSAKMGTLSLSRTTAIARAREGIRFNIYFMVETMIDAYHQYIFVNDLLSSLSGVAINEAVLSKSSFPGSVVVADDAAPDGTVWAVVRLGKSALIQEINQALVPNNQMTTFNLEARINAALARIYTEEVELNDGTIAVNIPRAEQPTRSGSGMPQFVRDEMKKAPEDSLLGVGSAKMDSLSYSTKLASIRARSEIFRQLSWGRYVMPNTEAFPRDLSFLDNFIAGSYKLDFVFKEVFWVTPDGTVWTVVQLDKSSITQERDLWQRLILTVPK